jgi:hypothetical protein
MTHIPIDERVLRLAARLDPEEAEHLLRSWAYHKDSVQELQRLFELGDGESESQSNDGV